MTRILVVEDSRTQAEAARAILEDSGYETVVEPHAKSALDRLTRERFDVVISDIVMPEMSGYELCRAVKAQDATKNIPVILLTTLSDPMDIIQGLESGADNFITKPYKPEYLVERVQTLLENKALRAGKSKVSVEIMFLGKIFTISSDREQILDLLIATFEDMVRTNRSLQATQAELSAANAKIEQYARALEGRVRHSEEKYRTLMAQAPDAIMVFDLDGNLLEANGCVEDLVRRPVAEMIGTRIDELCPVIAASLRRFLEHGERGEGSAEVRAHDGSLRLVEYKFSLTELGAGSVVLAIVRDVTERKRLEQQFHDASKFSAVASLAAGAAHDFNNVLMAILAYAEVLLRQIPDGAGPRRSAEEIRKAAKRGSWLTGQLLAFTRSAQAGDEPTEANEVLRNLAPMLKQLVGDAITIDMTLDPGLSVVDVEPGHVEQIAMNLVVNARDAMPSGGTILVRTSNVDLYDPAALGQPHLRPGKYVALTVVDTGGGMSRETVARIFTPLFTTKQKGRGTGLGLAIVQTIVSDAGGAIAVESEPGKGTEFTVYLPLREREASVAAGAARSPEALRGSEVVLVIHPEASIRSLMHEVLTAHGYTVYVARDRAEAQERVDQLAGTLDVIVATAPGSSGASLIPENASGRYKVVELPRSNGTPAAPIGAGDLLARIRDVLDRNGTSGMHNAAG